MRMYASSLSTRQEPEKQRVLLVKGEKQRSAGTEGRAIAAAVVVKCRLAAKLFSFKWARSRCG